jgi:4,5-DOPA dioxygenase extradiol
MERFPAIFVSHGAPTLAVDQNDAHFFLKGLGTQIGRPRAILVVSAHWMTAVPTLSLAERPETIHDFGGFPDFMYELKYPAPGAPAVATRAAELLRAAGHDISLHPSRGLDHGAWVPLMLMYPEADIPVVQLSIQPKGSPEDHWKLGEALRPLRDEGVLILGSGSATHNLREAFLFQATDPTPDYVIEFEKWLVDAITRGDKQALLRYMDQAPHADRAHPTNDHFYPLLAAAGAGDGATGGRLIHHSVTWVVLAMDAFAYA